MGPEPFLASRFSGLVIKAATTCTPCLPSTDHPGREESTRNGNEEPYCPGEVQLQNTFRQEPIVTPPQQIRREPQQVIQSGKKDAACC